MSSWLARLSNPDYVRRFQEKGFPKTGNEARDILLMQLFQKYIALIKRIWYLAQNVHLNTHRQRLSFRDKPYLRQLYPDFSDEIVIQKSVQCGISEMLLIRSLTYAEVGYSVLYVLPKYALRGRFVYNRVDPLFLVVPEYQRLLKEAVGESDSVALKHFGEGVINFVGSNSPSEFIEFPADLLIIDELDRCHQENLGLAVDRLDASNLKQKVRVSTPTFDDYGIKADFDNSDQKHWHIKCEHCNEYQGLKWDTHVVAQASKNSFELLDTKWNDEGEIRVFCQNCRKPLNRLSHDAKWIPTNSSDISGYHLSQLYSANTTIAVLWKTFQEAQSDETKLQIFYNSKLGEAYSPRGTRMSIEVLNQCRRNYLFDDIPAERNVFAGVDIGTRKHYVFAEHVGKEYFRLLDCGSVPEFNDLNLLFSKWKPKRVMMDIEPEVTKSKEFRDAHSSVWLCDYFGGSVEATTIREPKIEITERIISVDRTQTLDRMYAKFYNEQFWLPKDARTLSPRVGDKSELYTHLMNLQKITKDSGGREKAFWNKVGDDHLAHCANYMLLAYWAYREYGSPEIS